MSLASHLCVPFMASAVYYSNREKQAICIARRTHHHRSKSVIIHLIQMWTPPLSRIHIFSWTEFILLKNYTRLRAQEFPSRQCRHCFGNVWNSQLGFLLNWIFEENWLASSNRRLVINQKDQWREGGDLTCVTRAPMRRFSNVKSNFLV